jgi:hypothetical protein
VDDAGFLAELALYLQQEYGLNSEATFSCGYSNGGFMSYTLACEKPAVFKAIASVGGTMSGFDWKNREKARSTPVLEIHGMDDTFIPLDGSTKLSGGWAGAPHLDKVMQFWADKNNCQDKEVINWDNGTEVIKYDNGVNGNQVWYYKLADWTHYWPKKKDNLGFTASELIWDFFSLKVKDTSIKQVTTLKDFTLEQNYPNPFNPETTISFTLKQAQQVSLTLYNLKGEMVERILNKKMDAGRQTVNFNAENLTSGTYFYKLKTENKFEVKAMVLVK